MTWLRGFGAVTGAERVNQERFQESLIAIADEMSDGQTRTHTDHWDRRLTGSVFEELYYASGTSTITSTGAFTLTRRGNVTTITGTAEHRWWDPYDWHAGLGAYIPGHGFVSDEDALLLQTHRGASSFDMEARWSQTVTGEIIHRDWWFDSHTFSWGGATPESTPEDSTESTRTEESEHEPIGPEQPPEEPFVGPPAPTTMTYTVRLGDNLTKIARRFGVPGGWRAIYERNREVIGDDPNLILPGQELILDLGVRDLP